MLRKRCALEVFAWGLMEAARQNAEADKERPQAEHEDIPFLVPKSENDNTNVRRDCPVCHDTITPDEPLPF